MTDSDRLARLLHIAETDLAAASGGAPLCKVSTTGTLGQSVKYFEGRWAALQEVDRGADAEATLLAWKSEYQRHVDRGSGQAWVHYSAGGVDALSELLD